MLSSSAHCPMMKHDKRPYSSHDYAVCETHPASSFASSLEPLVEDTRQDEKPAFSFISLAKKICTGIFFRLRMSSSTSWKPFTLKAYTLGGIIALCLVLIWVLEFLTIYKLKQGALSFADENGRFTALQSFSYLYFPTILAVAFGMLYSWVDLDVKRLEPFFQLSRPYGALAQDSLTLRYPFDFLIFIPFTAAKLRHWSVFFAGNGLMLLYWVVIPLQSAIFTTSTFDTLIHHPKVMLSTGLMPLPEQISLNVGFMNKAYEFLWLSAPLPPFVTPQYAISPCRISEAAPISSAISTLEVETTAFWSELECKSIYTNLSMEALRVPNSGACGVVELVDSISHNDPHSVINYVPYWKWTGQAWNQNGQAPYLGLDTSCPVLAVHDILLLWAGSNYDSENQIRTNVTAQLCSAHYYQQPVKATLLLPDYRVISTERLGRRSNLSTTIFNATNFEYLVGLGQSSMELRGDWPDITTIQQGLKVEQLDISPPYSNMVGFALGNRSAGVQNYSHPQTLHQAFEAAHQLLFALAIDKLQGNTTSVMEGNVYGRSTGIILVPGFSIAVELALGLIAISTLGLLIVNWNRESKLGSDPASLQDFMLLLPDCGSLDPVLSGGSSSKEVQEALYNQRFRLERPFGVKNLSSRIFRLCGDASGTDSAVKADRSPSLHLVSHGVRPLELTKPVGILLGFVLLMVIVILATLLQRAHVLGGLPRPSNNIIARQILINFIPTIFATILEPTWVLINRLLCILQPFEALRACNIPASKSIGLRYTSLPPQLVVARALRAKHYLLASICLVALLANLLAVALSSVFQDSQVPQSQEFTFYQPNLPLLTSVLLPYDSKASELSQLEPLDHYYVLKSNLSTASPLPAWTNREFYFLPFVAESSFSRERLRYQATTRAFGISSTCHAIASSTGGPTELKIVPSKSLNILFSPTDPHSEQANCVARSLRDKLGDPYLPTQGKNSLESIYFFDSCPESVFIASWFRANLTGNSDWNSENANQLEYESLEYIVLSCEAKLRTANFLTTVDEAQQIVAAEQISPFEYEIDPYLSAGIDTGTILGKLNILMSFASQSRRVVWHSDTYAQEYFNAILKMLLNGTNTDPFSPLPSPLVLGPLVEDLYTRVFAILLGLSPTAFEEIVPKRGIAGKVFFEEPRIVMNPVMTILAISILLLNLVVAMVLYTKQPGKLVPRTPQTIADYLAFLSDRWENNKVGHVVSGKHNDEANETRWGFGKFIACDGRSKIGIERWPFVEPLTSDDFDDGHRNEIGKRTLPKWLSWNRKRQEFDPTGKAEECTSLAEQESCVYSWIGRFQNMLQKYSTRHLNPIGFKYDISNSASQDQQKAKLNRDTGKISRLEQEEWTCSEYNSVVDIGTLSGHPFSHED